jgi:predicted metal-dependent phosphoesterase TrpH
MEQPTTPRYDLHCHSTASDGLLAPRDVVALAVQRNLAGIALTDHDTVDGIAEAVEVGQALGVRVLPGIELSCSTEGGPPIHVLGYLVDITHPGLLELCASMRRERNERSQQMVQRLQQMGVSITDDDILTESKGAPPGRPHVARALVKSGVAADFEEAFGSAWIGPGGPAYVRREGLGLAQGIAAIHAAGGVAVIAHPGARNKHGFNESVVREAVAVGLDGIEVDHPDHEGHVVEQCVELARELSLVQTSGSDDHASGPEGPRLGCRTVPASIIAQLEARAAT